MTVEGKKSHQRSGISTALYRIHCFSTLVQGTFIILQRIVDHLRVYLLTHTTKH